MPVNFDWDNPDQTVMRFTTTNPWNWNDFHKALRLATFRLDGVQHAVEMVIDLRPSAKLPAGALGHIRSLGAAPHPNARNRLIIIGLDASIAGPLGGADGVYQQGDRSLHFVDSDEAAQALLADWLQE